MGIRLFSAVIMSHPAGIPNNIRFTKMFRPLIEKKKKPNYARKIREWISANKMRIFFSDEKTVKGHRICCSNSNDRDQLSVNKKTVKLNVNPSLTHVRTQSACYELKGDLSPLMLNEIFHDSLKISKFTRICIENHSSVNEWQKLFSSYNSNFRRPMQKVT